MTKAKERFALARARALDCKHLTTGRMQVTVRCQVSGCEASDTTETVPHTAPALIASRFRHRGWHVGDECDDARCPAHIGGKRNRRQGGVGSARLEPQLRVIADAIDETDKTTPTKTPAIEPTQDAPASLPSTGARAAQFKASRLLDEHFNADLRHYEDGWSDDRVASESGTSIAYVVETREAVFGPMVDREILAIRAEISAVDKRFQSTLTDLTTRIAEAEDEWTSAIRALDLKVESLEKRPR